MTSSHPTVFRRTASADGPTPGSHFGLAPELTKKARARVQWFAFAMVVMSLIGVGFNVVFLAVGIYEQQAFFRNVPILGANSAMAAVIWWVARTPRFGDSLVLTLGLGLEVLLCLGAAIATNMDSFQKYGAMAEMSWVTPIIILFPLIIPYPPRRMLVASLITAGTEPASVLFMWSTLPIAPDPEHLIVMIYPTLAAGLGYYASRIIWGLNVEVTQARRLGSYQLEARLGRGGMGEVWRASHRMLARPAAIKLVKPELLGTHDKAELSRVFARFEREAQVTANLVSPHTVDLYDFGRADDGRLYYVMELLHGVDLDTLVREQGPLPAERVIYLIIQVCHSLEEAHRAALVHRDIKPANIFTCIYGVDVDFVKVLDFGLVRQPHELSQDARQLTVDGRFTGTPAFASPEMATGEANIDGRTDIYALGCVAFWLLTGRLVFDTDTPVKSILAHVNEHPEAPSKFTEIPVPAALDQIVLDCLEKKPDGRPQTAAALAKRLEDVPLDRPWTPERAHRWWEIHRPAGVDQGPASD